MDLIKRVKNVVKVPVFAGSGVKAENIKDQLQIADGAIIGSSLKEGGIISNPISCEKSIRWIKRIIKRRKES